MAVRLSAASGRYSVDQNAEINVTPFVDVMLVLLIIFMVVAAAATSAVKVDLPITVPTDTFEPLEPITVSITADGSVYVNDAPAVLTDLSGVVRGLIADGRHEDRVIVRADKTVSYERFMEAMSTLNTGGVGKLALVSQIG